MPRTGWFVRKVDRNGSVSFAGANYRVGNAFRGRQVEVSLAGDTVQIWSDDRIIRTHAARHDRRKEHGAFANPGGRPDRINAAWYPAPHVVQVPEPFCRAGTAISHPHFSIAPDCEAVIQPPRPRPSAF